MNNKINDIIFYHIYPLGFCGAPKINEKSSKPVSRINYILEWIPHLLELGINAVYFGPVFESVSHGYDTIDYYVMDKRLGTNNDLHNLVSAFHNAGIYVVFDAVFNHVSKDFFAFKDILINRENSKYVNWFNIDFNRNSKSGENFYYECWENHSDLVKLNHNNNFVKEYFFKVIENWIKEFDIDGVRLDVAYCIDKIFLKELVSFSKNIKNDFWLMGEMIHGDYREIVNSNILDSATNYECYKGLYSSHNDNNYFEIAYSLNRLFGNNGLYKDIMLYNFIDNHDVDRISSKLHDEANLYPIYCLLFTIPGIPSIYYGSEWGIFGTKNHDDSSLRPQLDISIVSKDSKHKDLCEVVKKLSKIRKNSHGLKYGNYNQIFLDHEFFAFFRESDDEKILVVVNSSDQIKSLDLIIDKGSKMIDLLNNDEEFLIIDNHVFIEFCYPNWARILIVKG